MSRYTWRSSAVDRSSSLDESDELSKVADVSKSDSFKSFERDYAKIRSSSPSDEIGLAFLEGIVKIPLLYVILREKI